MSTYAFVVISPAITTRPVVTIVSQATRLVGSLAKRASSTPSEIWSANLSGWPMLTASLVKRYLPDATDALLVVCVSNRRMGGDEVADAVIINALRQGGQRA